jgi:hypothetical protein
MMSSDLPGVNPATLNGMILYYRLMTKWSGLGDSTELSRMGLSQRSTAGGRPPLRDRGVCILLYFADTMRYATIIPRQHN